MQRDSRFFYGWVIAGVSFVAMGLGYSIWYSFSVFFLAVIEEFHWGRANAALAFSVFVGVHGLTSPLAAMLVERLQLRLLMPMGAVLTGLTLAACSLVNEPWQYYLIFGVFSSMALNLVGNLPNYALQVRWFVRSRGLALGICSSGIGLLAITILVPANQIMISTIGWRSAYVVLGTLIAVVLAPLTFLLVRDCPEDLGLVPDGKRDDRASDPTSNPSSSRQNAVGTEGPRGQMLRQAIHTKPFWMLAIAYFVWPVAIQMVFVHTAAYIVDLGYSKMLAASVVGLIGLVSLPAKILGGHVSDRVGRGVTYALGATAALASLGLLLLMPAVHVEWLLYLFAAMFGLGYGTNTPLAPAIAGDIYTGKHFPTVYSFLTMALNFGGAAGPWLAGMLFDLQGSYSLAFLVAFASVFSAALLIWSVTSRPKPVAPIPAAL